MTEPTRRHLGSILALVVLQACAAPEGYSEARCLAEPDLYIATHGAGAEDLVGIPIDDGTSRQRIFAREVERGLAGLLTRCDTDKCRIGQVDIEPEPREAERQTVPAWRPEKEPEFHPLGMSLVKEESGTALYLIDAGKPTRLRKLSIKDGEVQNDEVVFTGQERWPAWRCQ